MVDPTDNFLYEKPAHLSDWKHSEYLDELFGFRCLEIENQLAKKSSFEKTTWKGLHPETLQTPYSQIFHFLKILKQHQIKAIVDFGAGYGRVALVMQSLFPQAKFIGYEIISERFQEAKRVLKALDIENTHMLNEDIVKDDFKIVQAEAYFIYDFSKPHYIKQLLSKIIEMNHNYFIIARGEGVRSIIHHHFPLFTVYRAYHDEDWSLYSNYTDISTENI